MKIAGIVFIIVGLALFLFFIYSLVSEEEKIKSPIPEEKGVRVIFVSPTK